MKLTSKKSLLLCSCLGMLAWMPAHHATAQTTVKLNVTAEKKQTITGFGAAAMGNLMRPLDDPKLITMAYAPDSEIGLNILRMEMSPNLVGDVVTPWDTPYDWHGYLTVVREAKKHGALILATPWSPPAVYKTNNSASGGKGDEYGNVHGKLKDASKLFPWFNTFLTYMQNNDAAVDVVALQNEPDWWVSYSGCEYTPQEMHDLVKQYAKRLTKEKFGVKLLGGEPLGFNPEYYRLLLEDPETDQYIDLIGGHVYGSYQCKENLAKAAGYAAPRGKEVWMTEHIVNPRGDEDTENHYLPTWHEQLLFAEDVNECLVNGATAYIYWYLAKEYSFIGDGTPCTTPGNVKDELLPRGRIMGQFARHLKGSTMLKVSSNLTSNLSNNVNQSFEMSAFMRGDSLIVNVIDTLNREFRLEVTLPYRAASLHRIQSTEDAVYAEDDVEIEPGKNFTFLVPARSFTTYIFRIDDETLAVEAPEATPAGKPADNAFYTLGGQRVTKPGKGVFIQNGKKKVF